MGTDPGDARCARRLAGRALEQLGRTPDRRRHRALLRRLSAGRIGREQPGWPVEPELATPWQDSGSGERRSWRCRAAYLPKDEYGQRVGHNKVIDEVDNAINGEVAEDLPAFEQSFDSRFDLVFSVSTTRSAAAVGSAGWSTPGPRLGICGAASPPPVWPPCGRTTRTCPGIPSAVTPLAPGHSGTPSARVSPAATCSGDSAPTSPPAEAGALAQRPTFESPA